MIKVCQRPYLIQALEHGLTFADDLTVNNALLTKYSLWEYLTPCDADNVNILNACIQRWRDEANKLFETTLFAYDPTLNYNIEEKGKDERTPDLTDERSPDLTDEISYNSTVTGAETGYDVPRTFEDVSKTTNGGKDTTTHKGKETLTKKGKETTEHGRTRAGTIGATQDLIAKERQIIIDCVSWYVEKFAQCFTVSLDINDYCGPCDLEPIADFLPPACDTPSGSITGRLDVIDNGIGALSQQLGDCCENMAGEIDALKKSVSDSKALLAGAITAKGVPTADDATFQTMADNIGDIQTGGAESQVVRWFIEEFDAGAISYITD